MPHASLPFAEPLLMLVIVLNFFTLGSSRLRASIRAVGVQGFVLGVAALALHPGQSWRGVAVSVGAMAIKGIVIPRMLDQGLEPGTTPRETHPHVGFVASLMLGAAGTAAALLFARTLAGDGAPSVGGSWLVVPAALSGVLAGFWMLVTRRTAISHVLGFLTIENGVFAFGLLLLDAMPELVEAGVLLDVFAGVFTMGLLLEQIDRDVAAAAHDGHDAEQEPLTSLRETGRFRAVRQTDPLGLRREEPR
ncbi:MAG: hydrogenase [Myxococcales bacterium]|nr:hydrogenase [Myxococcales bacterium]